MWALIGHFVWLCCRLITRRNKQNRAALKRRPRSRALGQSAHDSAVIRRQSFNQLQRPKIVGQLFIGFEGIFWIFTGFWLFIALYRNAYRSMALWTLYLKSFRCNSIRLKVSGRVYRLIFVHLKSYRLKSFEFVKFEDLRPRTEEVNRPTACRQEFCV